MTNVQTRQKLRFGCAEFRPENNTIRLYVYDWPQYYEVDLDRLSLPEWIEHIERKRWGVGSVLRDLAQCWAAAQPGALRI